MSEEGLALMPQRHFLKMTMCVPQVATSPTMLGQLFKKLQRTFCVVLWKVWTPIHDEASRGALLVSLVFVFNMQNLLKFMIS